MHVRFLPVLLTLAAATLPGLAEGPMLILIGTPSAGKTTQAEILHREYGMTVISADDLIAHNRDRFQKFTNPIITGVEPRLDPSMNSLVEQALQDADRTHGVVLDGYPASTSQGEFLVKLREKMNLPKAIVIHLQIPDDVARQRLEKEGANDANQQLKDYHREFDFSKTYFPQTDIHTLDGTKSPETIAAEIDKLLAASGITKK